MLRNKKTYIVILFIVLFLLISGLLLVSQFKNQKQVSFSEVSSSSEEPPLLLKNIGINLDYYNPKTNRAGDFLFTKQKLEFNRLFMGYGFFIPDYRGGLGKKNPQPTFVVPLKTPVRSLVDGIVVSIPTLWSGDYSVQVTADGQMQKWIYETEHLINPTVKVGDRVTAGQIDPSIKEEVFAKIKAFYKSWEEYQGDTALYNEGEEIPGCLKLDPIKG
ncbi:MAG: hypothetical protein UW69_C0100G0010 [Microgenomates group bacterium GW2011_GWA2_44_7]|nr:MAG: hypothetical protein UW69_C0100G0010 [Microgenomates group bacterium GW2011_GWA2_44_7]